MADAPPTPPADGPEPPNGRKRKAIGLFLLVLAATVIAGFAYWRYRQTHVSTDDAYIDGRIHLVSARVQGTVAEVRVRDNQPVKAGDPLLRIDPEPFAVRESGADFRRRRRGGGPGRRPGRPRRRPCGRDGRDKDLEGAKAQLAQLSAGIEAARAKDLPRRGAELPGVPGRRADEAALRAAGDQPGSVREGPDRRGGREGAGRLAKEELRLAEAAVPTQKALIAQREAVISQRRSVATQREARIRQQEAQVVQRESSLAEAKLLHRYTTILSPVGRVRHPEEPSRPGRWSPPASRSWPSPPWTTCG